MRHYALERKKSALLKMMPPNNMYICQLSLDTGIVGSTLYNWRKHAMDKVQLVLGYGRNTERWSSANKFVAVLETAYLNEAKIVRYSREQDFMQSK